ncbi:hypothetical protein K4F52_010097 [Lecanicillium sp. MT-2017a]|nr:hypothetical protein K4F52_010097 [Lecanicillium sp. MT-2017a]
MAAEKSPRILLFTNIDRGEANVFLAASAALYAANPSVDIHFSSFTGLEDDVSAISDEARKTYPDAKPITYHAINGLTMAQGMDEVFAVNNIDRLDKYIPSSFLQALSLSVTKQTIWDMAPILFPYTWPRMIEIYGSISEIIKKVQPDLVVVDSLMTAALTASWHMNVKFICLSPNSIKDFTTGTQPNAAWLWKFPATMTGHAYPVPWYQIPTNIYICLFTVVKIIRDRHRLESTKLLEDSTGAQLRTPLDLIRNRPKDLLVLVSSLPELDFPLIIPPDIKPCELAVWLAKGPTIFVSLGSLCHIPEDWAVELARALKKVLGVSDTQAATGSKLQVLWKLRKYGDYGDTEPGCRIQDIFGEGVSNDRVRIVKWVDADPVSVLRSGHVVCAVHHGGANSYNEVVLAAVPHVVLPQWTDCYDYAQRVEWLGIGRHGSRTHKPRWSADELSMALVDVLYGESAEAMKQKARDLAGVCEKQGDGAKNAARLILEQAVSAKSSSSLSGVQKKLA